MRAQVLSNQTTWNSWIRLNPIISKLFASSEIKDSIKIANLMQASAASIEICFDNIYFLVHLAYHGCIINSHFKQNHEWQIGKLFSMDMNIPAIRYQRSWKFGQYQLLHVHNKLDEMILWSKK